jgi:hypothetical protein
MPRTPEEEQALMDAAMRGGRGGASRRTPEQEEELLRRVPAAGSAAAAAPAADNKVWFNDQLVDPSFVGSNAVPLPPRGGRAAYSTPDYTQQQIERQQAEAAPGARLGAAAALPFTQLWKRMGEQFEGGQEMFKAGLSDIERQNVLTGTGKLVLGGLGATIGVPLGGAAKAWVEDPLTELTGNPEFAAAAGFVAPFGASGKLMSALMPKTTAALTYPASLAVPAIPAFLKPFIPSIKSFPENRAATLIADHAGDHAGEYVRRITNNPNLTLADVNPTAQSFTTGIRADSSNPVAQQIVKDVADQRNALKAERALTAIDETIGAPPNATERLAQIKKAARDHGAKVINPIVSSVKGPVPIPKAIDAIDNELPAWKFGGLKIGEQPQGSLTDFENRLWSWREQLRAMSRVPGKMTMTAEDLHTMQSKMRVEADALTKSSDGAQRLTGAALYRVREGLIKSLDDMTPAGATSYRNALRGYADEMDVQDAWNRGLSIFQNPGQSPESVAAHDPSAWWAWISNTKTKPTAIIAAQDAARYQAAARIKGYRNRPDIPQESFAADKFRMLFGSREGQALIDRLADERDIANTTNKWEGGSKTAETQKAQGQLQAREVKPSGGEARALSYITPFLVGGGAHYLGGGNLALTLASAGATTGLALGGRVARGVTQRLGRLSDLKTADEYARLATAPAGSRKQRELLDILRAVAARPQNDRLTDLARMLSGPVRSFQAGGRPVPGQPAIVGEGGPEIWVPDNPLMRVMYSQQEQPTDTGQMRQHNLMELLRERNEEPQPQQIIIVPGKPTGKGRVISRRQAGGPLDQGQPSLVGEQGPEVFVPDRPGTIVPSGGFVNPVWARRRSGGLAAQAGAPGNPAELAGAQLRQQAAGAVDAGTRGGAAGGITAAYQAGGRPWPGTPALVGEKGPELFVPDQWREQMPQAQQPWLQQWGQRVMPFNFLGTQIPPPQVPPVMRRFQAGGRPAPGDPAVVGEAGPEAWVPDEPGAAEPGVNWLQRLARQPSRAGSLAVLRALAPNIASIASGEPAERPPAWPAYGKVRSPTVDPRLSGAGFEATSALPMLLAPELLPEAAAARTAGPLGRLGSEFGIAETMGRAATHPAATALGTGGGVAAAVMPNSAIAADDPRVAEIKAAEQRIQAARQQIITLGMTRTKSAPGTQRATQDALQKGIDSDQARIDSLHQALAVEEERGRQAQAAEMERTRAAAAAKEESERSYRQRYPIPGVGPAANLIPFLAPVVGGMTGYGLGRYTRAGQEAASAEWQKAVDAATKQFAKKGGRSSAAGKGAAAELRAQQATYPGWGGPMAAGIGASAAEGAAGPMFMAGADVENLPVGSPSQKLAGEQLRDPYWWLSRVGTPAAMSALFSSIGYGKGYRHGGAPVRPPVAQTRALLPRG